MSFLSKLHSDIRRVRLTKRGSTHKAENVPKGRHKEYPRMPRIILPEPRTLDIRLTDILYRRYSTLRESGDEALSLDDVSILLGHGLRRRKDRVNRNYPSGGALYPIETYLVATKLADSEGGVFHYHPTAHALERLWDLPDDFSMKNLVSKPDFLAPSTVLLFTSVWERSSAKYGDFTYGLALLEAGHMGENIMLLSSALGLESRPMAGFNDSTVSNLLDLRDNEEQPVHSITFSKSSTSTNQDNLETLGE